MTVCASCGAWFAWPPQTAASMREHYDQNKAGMPGELRQWRIDTSQEKWYQHLARRIARKAVDAKLLGEITAVVDVGAGGLELTVNLAREFPRARVEAWDLFADGFDRAVSSDASGRISCRRVDLNRLDEASVPQGSFEVVACVAVIEHVLDPLALLRFLRSITAPGGFAYVVGPEVTSAAHRLMRRFWPYYCTDEHVTLPSLASIEKAVAIAGGGTFQLRRVNVHYSLKYLMRFLHIPIPIPAWMDFLLPIPAGAFELIWEKA
jgi:2-polyprenyl-3-methyl-5-hydroxy-6-metoxy-1,4-benzoquinol methylase